MRKSFLFIILTTSVLGCKNFVVKTENKVGMMGPVETKVTTDILPVSIAGGVVAVPVQAGNTCTRVVVLDVDGLILNTPFVGPMSLGENPVALFREKLDAIEVDPKVKAVVLRVNSPGGGVAACQAMRRDLERFKARTHLPVIACLMDTATGGAYALASSADSIVAGPATVTGGLGVILNLYNLQDLMAQFNIIPQAVKAGVNVDIGTSARSLQPAEKKLLQDMADDFHNQLEADIRKSRPKTDRAATTFDGRIFTASQALANGLVDRIGDLDDALQLAGLMSCPSNPENRPEVVLYRRVNDPAHSVYAITANVPLQGSGLFPSLPGLDRSKLPTFLSMWQPELTTEKLAGR